MYRCTMLHIQFLQNSGPVGMSTRRANDGVGSERQPKDWRVLWRRAARGVYRSGVSPCFKLADIHAECQWQTNPAQAGSQNKRPRDSVVNFVGFPEPKLISVEVQAHAFFSGNKFYYYIPTLSIKCGRGVVTGIVAGCRSGCRSAVAVLSRCCHGVGELGLRSDNSTVSVRTE